MATDATSSRTTSSACPDTLTRSSRPFVGPDVRLTGAAVTTFGVIVSSVRVASIVRFGV